MLEGIAVVWPLGIQDGCCIGHYLVWNMVITNDEFDSQRLGILNLLYGLDAAVENDDEVHAGVACVLQSLLAYAVTFVVAVGDVIINVRVELP